ncbi:hypothetical protein B0H14DRAFT_1610962 [Mycena olivaceomarginata]|nr:hypothetical protein B0H14DRAFT_1610962 [Mycena olivaceomarginata]
MFRSAESESGRPWSSQIGEVRPCTLPLHLHFFLQLLLRLGAQTAAAAAAAARAHFHSPAQMREVVPTRQLLPHFDRLLAIRQHKRWGEETSARGRMSSSSAAAVGPRCCRCTGAPFLLALPRLPSLHPSQLLAEVSIGRARGVRATVPPYTTATAIIAITSFFSFSTPSLCPTAHPSPPSLPVSVPRPVLYASERARARPASYARPRSSSRS